MMLINTRRVTVWCMNCDIPTRTAMVKADKEGLRSKTIEVNCHGKKDHFKLNETVFKDYEVVK